jgi:hypothetical protein
MRSAEIVAQPRGQQVPVMRAILEAVRVAHAERIRPEIGWPSPAQRAALRSEVECHGLSVHDLGEAFAAEFHGRERWCRDNCRGAFSVEPIRPEGGGRDTGRRFLFAGAADAAAFRRRWR